MTLKELRKQKQLSQEKASQICGVPLRTYKRLEKDDKYINTYKYDKCLTLLKKYQVNSGSKHSNVRFNIAIVGAGYVGYSLGLVLSHHSDITLIDINKDRVDAINKEGNLKASLPCLDVYKDKDYIFVCVPTNYDSETGLLDTKGVTQVVKDVRNVNDKVSIVIKSTCNIGYTRSLDDKNIIYCPEFLREKYAIEDMRHPSRIVIGSNNKDIKVTRLGKLLQLCAFNRPNVLYMSTDEAEAVKLFSNAYLAMRVSFFNELDSFASDNNINTHNIINGVSLDPRIGDYYNNPSIGYSGKCLPKDTLALAHLTGGELISSIDRSNEIRKKQTSK